MKNDMVKPIPPPNHCKKRSEKERVTAIYYSFEESLERTADSSRRLEFYGDHWIMRILRHGNHFICFASMKLHSLFFQSVLFLCMFLFLVWTGMADIDSIVLQINPDNVPFGNIAGNQGSSDTCFQLPLNISS